MLRWSQCTKLSNLSFGFRKQNALLINFCHRFLNQPLNNINSIKSILCHTAKEEITAKRSIKELKLSSESYLSLRREKTLR